MGLLKNLKSLYVSALRYLSLLNGLGTVSKPSPDSKGSVLVSSDVAQHRNSYAKEQIDTKPNHYVNGRKIQPLDVIDDWDLWKDGYLMTVFKYIARAGRKPGNSKLSDLRKARHYLHRRIQLLERGRD